MEHSYAIYAFILIAVVVALSVSLGDMKSEWYKSLKQPPGVPPDWVFGLVWSLLYIMLLIGVMIATWNQVGWSWTIIVVYTVLLILTLLWVIVFNQYHNIVGGVIILLATLGLGAYMIYLLLPSHLQEMGIWGGAQYVPIVFYSLFLAWIACATYFNMGIAVLN